MHLGNIDFAGGDGAGEMCEMGDSEASAVGSSAAARLLGAVESLETSRVDGRGLVRRRAEPAPGALAPRRGRFGESQRELEALVADYQHARHRRQQGDVVDGLGHCCQWCLIINQECSAGYARLQILAFKSI